MSRRAQLVCAWCGPGLFLLFAPGAILLSKFIPPDIGPRDSAQETVRIMSENPDQMRIGLLLMVTGFTLLPLWGASMLAQLRRLEGRFPVLIYAQIASIAVATVFASSGAVFWTVAAFRPTELDPQFTRFALDLGWHFFLWTPQPFTIWCICLGFAILGPHGEKIYPRWAGYLSIWTGILFAPAVAVTFFKHGAFGWQGVIGLYEPFAIFAIWILTMTYLTIQNVNRGAHESDEGVALGPAEPTDAAPYEPVAP